MSEKSITILELHLGDGDINVGPLGVSGRLDGTDETSGATGADEIGADGAGGAGGAESDSGCGCSVKSIGGFLLVLGLLAAVGVGVTKLLGDDGDEIDIDG